MPDIRQLDSHVADLIAAGEVVERPASVVKELVENAIDAGASAVVVEIRRGGMGLIRVTDNGCGIAPQELPTAFLRHATSKLRGADDLGRIGTLGFRGEALAAISAVSHVEILTRRRDAAEGASLRLEGGVPGTVEPAGAPEGTTLVVRDLFYNTPARLKFMRKDSAETAAVNGLMQHLALSHPDVSFRFLKDGTEALHTPGDGKLDSAVYAALGRDFARGLTPVQGRGGEIRVSGFVTRPLMGRGSRSMQTFFVNGRFIKSQLLTAALEEGYRNQLLKGKFPGCVLAVELPVTDVDVNVHPAKTQVKFSRENEVFQTVYHTVMDALDTPETSPDAAKTPDASKSRVEAPQGAATQERFFKTMDAAAYRAQTAEKESPARPGWHSEQSASVRVAESAPRQSFYQVTPAKETPWRASALSAPPASVAMGAAARPAKQGAGIQNALPSVLSPLPQKATLTAPAPTPAIPAAPQTKPEAAAPKPQEMEQQTLEHPREAPWRVAGEVLHTYIVCESEDGCVWLIDKHAAHERVNFDRLKNAKIPPMRQTLLSPVAVELRPEDGALLLENLPLLDQLGFSCEDFGDGAVLVREVPSDLDADAVPSTLEEMAEALRTGRSLDEKREQLFHTMACKAAIKGGWTSDPAELRVLVDKVQSGEVRYCPHGRPVAVKLTGYELEKMFKRA